MGLALAGLAGLLTGPLWLQMGHAGVEGGPLFGLPRCASCGARLGCRHRPPWTLLAGSLLSALLFAAAWAAAPIGWARPGFLVAAAAATAITVADLKAKLIPNRILYPATGMVVVALVAAAALAGQPERITRGSLTGGAYFLVLLGVAVVSRGGFGMGDVKLGFLLGFLTGYVSLPIFLAGVFFTGIAGGIPAIALLLTRRARRDQELPYGPAMVVGTWAALTVGGSFLVWYQG